MENLFSTQLNMDIFQEILQIIQEATKLLMSIPCVCALQIRYIFNNIYINFCLQWSILLHENLS